MARLEMVNLDEFQDRLSRLEKDIRGRIAREMLTAGAEVIARNTAAEIRARGHIRTGDMLESLRATEIREGLDGMQLYVYTQDEDRHGVRNEMKNVIINYGYYQKRSGRNVRKDPFVKRVRDRSEREVHEAMEAAYTRGLREAGLTEE